MADLTPQNLEIARLYTALFNRAPDASGFAFWVQAHNSGASLTALAQSMMTSPEAMALYPAGQTNEQFVTAYYTSVFGRAPDAGGLAFWTAALDAQGGASNAAARAGLTLQISTIASTPLASRPAGMSDEAYNQTVADRGRFINKTEFGVYFAADLKSNDLTLAKTSFALVTDNPASLTAATNAASGAATPAPAPEPVLTITAADLAADITGKFAAYQYGSATVDATGMDAGQLKAVASQVNKISAGGITGTFALDNSYLSTELSALLGIRTAVSATVSVDGTGMSGAQKGILGSNAARIDSLANPGSVQLTLPDDADGLIFTPDVLAGLFSIAPPASIRLTSGLYATGAQVNVIAAHLDKVSSQLGATGIGIDSDVTPASIDLLTKARADNGLVHQIAVTPDGMNAEQIAAVVRGLAGATRPGVTSLTIGQGTSADIIATLLATPGIDRVSVTVSGYGMTNTAQIAAISQNSLNIDSYYDAVLLVLGDAAITDAVTGGVLTLGSRLAAGQTTVDATQASPGELALLAANSLALREIVGTLSLDRNMTDAQLDALLSKATVAADVQLDVSGMSAAQLIVVATQLAKVDGIAPVDVGGMNAAQLTALSGTAAKLGAITGWSLAFPSGFNTTVLGTLLPRAAAGSVAVVGTGASAAELTVLAANLDKIAPTGVTGTLLLTKDANVATITSLLGAQATTAATIDVDAAGMTGAQLEAVSAGIGRVHSLTNQPEIVLATAGLTDTALGSLLSMAADGSLRVNAAGGTPTQLALVANAATKLATDGMTGAFTLDASLTDTQLAALLGDRTAVGATVTANASNMDSTQLAALNAGSVKLDSVTALPQLKLGDAAMTEALITWLVSLAPYQSLTADTTGASIAKIHALASGSGEKIAQDGLTGNLNITAELRADLFYTIFMSKASAAANVQVDATGMSIVQLADVGFMREKIDGVIGVSVKLTDFQNDPNLSRYLEPLMLAANVGTVKMDLTGAYWDTLRSAVLPNMAKFADGGLTGTFTLSSAATIDQVKAILTPKLAGDAAVTVQVGTTTNELLTELAPLAPQIAAITNLELRLSDLTVDSMTLEPVMAKATGAKVWMAGASSGAVDLVLSHLSSVGAFQDLVSLTAARFGVMDKVLLGSKVSGYPGLQITGDAGDETIDLTGVAGNARIDGGAGADTITTGNGADVVFIGSRSDTRAASFSGEADTALGNIDVIKLGASDLLKFSTVAEVFGPGVATGKGSAVHMRTIATADTFDALYTALNVQGAFTGSSAINEFVRVTVSAGSLAGNYLIINDSTATIGINDTIIGIEVSGFADNIYWFGF